MYAEERQRLIARLVRETGRAEAAALAQELEVSPETIRKDILALERAGRLQRVHGGAIAVDAGSVERRLAERTTNEPEKERIARAAVRQLGSPGSVFIEAGTTTERVARLLPADRDLTVVTNTPTLAAQLAERRPTTVLLVGGRIRRTTFAAVDDWALRTLRDVRVDVALLGTNGISRDGGLTTPDPAEAAVKRLALEIAPRTLLLADHTKVGRASTCRYGELSAVDLLITDDGLPAAAAAELAEAGHAVLMA
jgi:DeoR family fructose operon transcriptional repressor